MALKKNLGTTEFNLKSFVISTELDEYAVEKQKNNPVDGCIYIYTWNEIFDKLETKFTDIQKDITKQIKQEDGFRYLQQLYKDVLGEQI